MRHFRTRGLRKGSNLLCFVSRQVFKEMLFTSALFVYTLIFLQFSVDKTKGSHILCKSNKDSLWGIGDLSLSETSDYSRSSFVMLPKCSGKLAKKERNFI